ATMTVAINDPQITWATYKVGQYLVPWTDQAAARTSVRYERRLELAMEGQRFFDLRRYGIDTATATINTYLTEEKTRRGYKTAQLPFAPRNMLYPIPPNEIDLSKVGTQSMLTQNPGW
ncbi:MAG: RagB/SusD family nutrient uptake outer membrane protein, partial [Gemmatimonadales bacterium]